MSRRRPAAVLLAGALLMSATGVLAGCGQQTGTEEAASTSGAPTSAAAAAEVTSDESGAVAPSSSAAPVPDDGQPFPGDTAPDTAEAVSPEGLTVTGVRIGAHDGHDRVVL